MEGISDLRIIGFDEKRPPKIRKEPYIDLFFQLSHQAPSDWCNDFNSLLSKHPAKPKIIEKEGLYIEAWVKKPEDISPLLDTLKLNVHKCSVNYVEKITRSARNADSVNASLAEEQGEQGRLNKIVAQLNFDDIEELVP